MSSQVDSSFCSAHDALQNEPLLSRIRAAMRKLQVRENVAFSKLRAPVTFHAPQCPARLIAHFVRLAMAFKMSHYSAGSELR
ncbi:hypothetical protein Ddc_19232 [Ditylenchus destructor]|nr:hypothetical protein Ddc_19232 [Ditylenchus destructor]